MPVQDEVIYHHEDVKDNPLLNAQFKEKNSYVCLDDLKKTMQEEIMRPNSALKKYFRDKKVKNVYDHYETISKMCKQGFSTLDPSLKKMHDLQTDPKVKKATRAYHVQEIR